MRRRKKGGLGNPDEGHGVSDERQTGVSAPRGEEHFRLLIENALDLVVVLRADGTIIYASPSVRHLLGYDPAEMVGEDIVSFVHPEDIDEARSALALAAGRPGVTKYIELRVRHRDGSWRLHEASAYNLLGDPTIGGLVINSRDISERKRAERLIEIQRDLGVKLGATGDLMEALRISLDAVLEATGLDCGGIYILDDASGGFELAHHVGLSGAFVESIRRYDAASPRTALVKAGQALYTKYDELPVPKGEAHLEEGLKAIAVVPIMHEGRAIGCVNVASHYIDEISSATRDIIELMLSHIGQAIAHIRLNAAVRESEKYFRALIENATDVITILEADGTIRYESPSLRRLLGWMPEELIGKNIFDYLHPDDVTLALEAFRGGIEIPGNSSYMEVRFLHKDGSWRWFGGIGSNLLHDPAIEGILLNSQDITDRKQAEVALRVSEGQYRSTFESTGTAMFLVDREAVISGANLEMEKVFGYHREEVVGRMRYMKLLMPEDVEKVKGCSRDLLNGDMEGPIQYEIRARHKTGRPIDALISINMLPGMDSSVISLIDITEKKAYERMLEENAEQLRDFLDIAAHELRHPATLLKGYALTLASHGEDIGKDDWFASLMGIEAGVDRLVYVVEELLDVSRLQRGKLPLRLEEAQPGAIAASAVEEMLVRETGRDIALDLAKDLGTARVDPERLIRLFIILLDNAVRYSPPGSTVEVKGERRAGELLFSVLDRGVGIPQEDGRKIFERFYQVEDALHHSGPGLGLGLYIGRSIVEANGGRIWYEPREGGGSTFSFTIPLLGT